MMTFDAHAYPWPSRRTLVYGRHGMVATAQPLAAQAGLEVLQNGGNAIDAAIAAAASLSVVEPTSNGLGGDAFAIVWSKGQMYGLNSSGYAPRYLTPERVRSEGAETMPTHGWNTVTVPGIPAAWAALSRRLGAVSLARAIAPAIRLAKEGYPVSPTVSYYWGRAYDRFTEILQGPEYAEWFKLFAPEGHTPEPGEIWASPDHGATLEEIARTDAESFYRGQIAERIVKFSQATGGTMTAEDLAAFEPEWVTPLSVSYHGYDVWELPPNGQGLVALMALKMLGGLHASSEEERMHQTIEALKLAFADAAGHFADPVFMAQDPQDFLGTSYTAARGALIGERAQRREAGAPVPGGTVYLATADDQGNMVSFIQSNYAGFGSGLVVPSTGIALQNRGSLFSLDPRHPNVLAPGKRPFHTIIPGFLTHQGQPVGPFGVMGGFMQPQGHVQLLRNILESAMNPQAALDAPRFYWQEGNTVMVESTMPQNIVDGLRRRGHDVQVAGETGPFGRGEVVWRLENGVLMGATEPRADGTVACW